MTCEEFSIEFDLLFNNINSNIAPGINDYEKSILLTQAQESVINDVYRGTLTTDAFEKSEEVTQYLQNILVSFFPEKTSGSTLDKNSQVYKIPEDLMLIIHEQATLDSTDSCLKDRGISVVPTEHDYYSRIKNNPFRGPSKDRALRLLHDGKIELICPTPIKDYHLRYLRFPRPIILIDLDSEGLFISSGKKQYNKKSECELHPNLHRAILLRAVQMAKIAWSNGN